MSYSVAYARQRLVAIELATGFDLVVYGAARPSRVALGDAAFDVADVAVNATGDAAWIASRDGTVRSITIAGSDRNGNSTHHHWHLGAPATAVAVSADNRHVATGDSSGAVCPRRTHDGALLQCAAIHRGEIAALSFDRNRLASAAHDGSVIAWKVPSQRILWSRTRRGSANAVAWDASGKHLAVGWSGHPPKRTPEVAAREVAHGFGAPDPDATLEVIAMTDGNTVTCIGHAAAVTAVTWTRGNQRVISASWDRTLRLWDPTNGAQLGRLGGFDYLVADVAAAPDGRTLAVAAWAASLRGRATTIVDLLYP